MSETLQIVLAFVLLVLVFALTRLWIAWKMSRTATAIARDLEARGAFDPVSAAHLPYAKQSLLHIGMRDYRSKALEYLVSDGTVGKTGDERYYLNVQNRATLVAGTQRRPGSEGTGGLSRQSSSFGKSALTHGLGEYASCRFAAWTYNVQATRISSSAGVPLFEHLQGLRGTLLRPRLTKYRPVNSLKCSHFLERPGP